jgi:CheY-like chemotaxis protein
MTAVEPRVLLVDNSEEDILLMRTVFERVGFAGPLQFARGGDEAIAYLRGDGAYGDRQRFSLPTVLLLDLNMPRKDGFEVLKWIRAQPGLRRLCVYILSASSRPEDIDRAYDLGANSYLVKPSNLDGLMHLTKCLVAWLKISRLSALSDPAEDHEPVAAGEARAHARGPGHLVG